MFLSRITQTVILSLCLLLSTPMTMYSASFYINNSSIESMFVVLCALGIIGGIVLGGVVVGFALANMTAPQNNLQHNKQEDITMRAQIVLDDFYNNIIFYLIRCTDKNNHQLTTSM